LSLFRKSVRQRRLHLAGLREHGDESNHLRGSLRLKGIVRLDPEQIPAVAYGHCSIEGQLSEQLGAKPASGSRLAHHEGPGCSHIHHIELTQLSDQRTGTKGSVAAHVDPAE